MKKNTILWADDDADDLQLMREILMKNHQEFTIIEVGNGKEALHYLEKSSQKDLPCLVILDINMPILDGKETLTLIRKNEKLDEIPVVIFTTSASEMDKLFCRKHGTRMITKPPNYSKLESIVIELLEYCNAQ